MRTKRADIAPHKCGAPSALLGDPLCAERLGDGVGAFFDHFQEDARGGFWLAAALFPVAHGAQRETVAPREAHLAMTIWGIRAQQ